MVMTDRIDGLSTSVAVKAPVKVGTTAAITLSGTQTIDGVALVEGDRVLVKNQSDTKTNGIYLVNASTWTRAKDFDGARDAVNGTLVYVAQGATLEDTYFRVTTVDPVVFGSSNITFEEAVLSSAAVEAANAAAASAALAETFANALAGFDTSVFASPYSADPTGVTGGSTALQTLIDTLNTQGGGVATWRGGYLNIDSQITAKGHVHLRGWSDDRLAIRQATANETGISGGAPNTAIFITHGTGAGTSSTDATFVLNSASAGVHNTLISYPNQLVSNSSPVAYSPTFGVGIRVGFTLKNLCILNSYIWLKLDTAVGSGVGGGHCVIENIIGTPLYRAFWLDQIGESFTIRGIKMWKFWAPGNDTGALADWLHENGVAFYIGGVDALNIEDVSTYNLKTTYHLVQGSAGTNRAPWLTTSNFHCDNNITPIYIEDVNFANFTNGVIIGDVEAQADGNAGITITEGVFQDSARANFNNIDAYNLAHFAHIKAMRGQFNFSNITLKTKIEGNRAARYALNNIQNTAFIDEGRGANIKISNLARGVNKTWEAIFGGGETLQVDGIKLPNRGKWFAISSITKANPAVVTTAAAHGLTTGDTVYMSACKGMTEVNHTYYTVTVLSGTTFSLDGVNSSSYNTHTADSGQVLVTEALALTGWDDIANWSGSTAGVTNVTGGLSFNMTTAASPNITFTLPATFNDEGIAMLEFELDQDFTGTINAATVFNVTIEDGSGNILSSMVEVGGVPHYENNPKLIFPIITAPSGTIIRVVYGNYTTSGAGTITLKNMRAFRPTREFLTNAYFDAVYGTTRYGTAYGKRITMDGHNKVVRDTAAPVTGKWVQGDRIVNSNPTAGDVMGWICVAGGTPGTWKELPTISL